MKKLLLILSLSIVHCQLSIAQNVGIGTDTPTNKLQVAGNILVGQPLISTVTPPRAAGQTRTLINGLTITFSTADSTGRIYDPGGPAGNYDANLSAIGSIPANNTSQGFVITIEEIGLNQGDSLLVKDAAANPSVTFLAFGSQNQATGTFIINSPSAAIFFKSNTDGFVGSGFSLLFKRLFPQPDQSAVNGYAGQVMYYDAVNDVFRAGVAPAADNPGVNSAAFGYHTTASGPSSHATGSQSTASGFASLATGSGTLAAANNSTAMGLGSRATGLASTAIGDSSVAQGESSAVIGYRNSAGGQYSIAMGNKSSASGAFATAIGTNATAGGYGATAIGTDLLANGDFSTAMGIDATTIGYGSTAMGVNVTASGGYSTAMGYHASTAFHGGSFVIGDVSTSTDLTSSASNQMNMRFAGGYRLYSNSGKTTGVTLAAGGGSWSSVSDKRKKENFRTINNEELLQKVASLPITNWNYISQPASQRHIGPMAQDFYAAFHLDGEGADTTINTMDIGGVNMAAIQALEKRTAQLNEELKRQIAKLEAENSTFKSALAELQAQVKELQRSRSTSTADRNKQRTTN